MLLKFPFEKIMKSEFKLPPGLLGRFAIVKLWPEMKTAEDECIARLKIAASALDIECVEIDAEGRFLAAPGMTANKASVDFVIHLHYDTPKLYDAFSFVALWNPLKFYHEWGYARCSRNLTTHDDFISCSSDAADDHVSRMIRRTNTHLPAKFHLYHSTGDVIYEPSRGDGKLFYAGINWEAISGGKSRHQEVLKRLDKTGLMRIYGPTVFSGVRVWAGYESYVREVPFDGFSMIDEIAKAGIALVLSSPAHKDSELMSNRLFESIAAGALVICDENPFGKRFFGDSLLYIDSRSPVDQIHADILRHLDWANKFPDLVLEKIAKAQQIFRDKYTLIRNLSDLYVGLDERKQNLLDRQNPPEVPRPLIQLNLLMPQYSESVLNVHLRSIAVQEYREFSPVLVVDRKNSEDIKIKINAIIAKSPVHVELLEVDFYKYGIHPEHTTRRRMGEIINALLNRYCLTNAFMVVAPNESLLSNHLSVLAGALQRDSNTHCAATAAILRDGVLPVHSIHEVIDFGHVNPHGPCGYGRFIFRRSAIPEDIELALPYLDGRPLAVLVGCNTIHQQLPATMCIDTRNEFPERTWDDHSENRIVQDFSPRAFQIAAGVGVTPSVIAALPALHVSKIKKVLRRLLDRRWIISQIHAIRKYGLGARIHVLKRKLG